MPYSCDKKLIDFSMFLPKLSPGSAILLAFWGKGAGGIWTKLFFLMSHYDKVLAEVVGSNPSTRSTFIYEGTTVLNRACFWVVVGQAY